MDVPVASCYLVAMQGLEIVLKLTDEQAHAVDLFKTSCSLKISAFAGTGKTSTLIAISQSTKKSGLYLAFNKSIATEAATKFARNVTCKTMHSLAFAATPNVYRANSKKVFDSLHSNHVAQLLGIQEIAAGNMLLKPRSLAFLTAKTVQRFCQSGDDEILVHHVPVTGKLQKLEAWQQVEFKDYVSKLAAHLWHRMLDPASGAPLGHDGYLKLWSLSKPQLEHDFILLDEAQDANEAVLSVLRAQDSHLTLVGDKHQQIYEWRGAVNAMASVESEAEAVLTQSFRFGKTVAEAATSILRVLGEERPLIGRPGNDTAIAASGRTGTVLCRTNAGVISVVIDALGDHRRPHVVGGVKELIRMLEDVSRLKASLPADSPEFFGFINWPDVVDFAGSDEGESLRSFVNIVVANGEVNLIEKLGAVALEEIEADLIVSTGHKAKGREWDSVTLSTDFDLRVDRDDPTKTVLSPEEGRLLYVAITRAKELLVVPPRLARKWKVTPAMALPIHVPVPSTAVAAPAKAMPTLPSFAKVVPPTSTAAPTRTPQPASPYRAAPATSNRPVQNAKPATSQPGLLSSLFSLFKT